MAETRPSSAESVPYAMPLRSDRFDVPNRRAVNIDQLDRDQRILAFCEDLVSASETSLTLVNGEWGSGKTFFIERCAEILRSSCPPKPHVVQFNAWRQSHSKDPLLDMTHCMTAGLNGKTRRSLRSVARKATRHMAMSVNDAVARKTWGLLDIRHLQVGSKSQWEIAEQELSVFGERLQRKSCQQRIILLIDELDRCEPTHALSVIETAHHLFRVPNVQIVIAVNQGALEQSIQNTYGTSYDAERYLRRFIDSTHQLPDPPANVVAGYIESRMHDLPAMPSELFDASCLATKFLSLAILCPTRSFRDVDIAVRLMQRVLSDVKAKHDRLVAGDSQLKLAQLINFAAALITLRLALPASYRQLLEDPTNGFGAWLRFRKDYGYYFHHRYTELKTSEYLHEFFSHLVALGGTSSSGGIPMVGRSDVSPIFPDQAVDHLVSKVVALRRTQGSAANSDEAPMSISVPILDWARAIDEEMPALVGPVED